MNKFIFTVEHEAFEGVKRVAQKSAEDFEKVCGTAPQITSEYKAVPNAVIFATLGNSPLVDEMIKHGAYEPSAVQGKREVYQIKLLDGDYKNTLLICGSDKRGTIYGIFALSEFIGVSPLHFWGDVEPVRRDGITITKEIETVSKQPGVKYRGFFINDEWPCYGNWTFSHFNGFTAEMYERVFELLLRLKGNYLWPAMWSSSFPLDGPGGANEELADIYGVIMGASHHEPCLRASEEWDKVRGEESVYGNEWNYYKNKDGLLKYWEDGIKRSGKYENIITLGMRGERDSSMLGDDSSLKDNIDLLKDIIKNQRELIKKYVNADLSQVPQLLALYKEVEPYFYGEPETVGLKSWSELDGVTCMLCEDNFGFMRTLPTEDIRGRAGGFGMYYHFDYHGGPISYEWMASVPFSKTWEQMTMAYDYGIRDIWIVNVGDLKFNEVPLAYFLELAYDFEKWGTNSPNSTQEYTELWLKKTFLSVDAATREKMSTVLTEYIRMNSLRRPEAQNPYIYHPCHYLESDRMLDLAHNIEKLNEEVYSSLSGNEKDAYYSLIYFPAKSSVNLTRMNLYSGKSRHYACQGRKIANTYSSLVTDCIEQDRNLKEQFAEFKGGKWKGMELEQHIGFTKWNEDNCRYPLRYTVEPAYKPRLSVSRKDREGVYSKAYGTPETITVDDFLYLGNDEVILEIANDGIGAAEYKIEADGLHDWLKISCAEGAAEVQDEIVLRCDRSKLTQEVRAARLFIKDAETTVAVTVRARNQNTDDLPPMTFLENDGVIAIEANHFCGKKDVSRGGFAELKGYGRSGAGMKVFPTTADFGEDEENPTLTYRFLIEEAGDYTVEIWTAPTNSVQDKRPLRFALSGDNGEKRVITAVDADFKAGSPGDEKWCRGVLDNIRVNSAEMNFKEGVREVSLGALEAGLVVERVLVYKKGSTPPKSYLGVPESYFKKQ